jgi:hypothetical protein
MIMNPSDPAYVAHELINEITNRINKKIDDLRMQILHCPKKSKSYLKGMVDGLEWVKANLT